MSLGVEVSARGTSVIVVLSGTAEAAALDGLKPAFAAALGEAEAVVIDARMLSVVESADLERMLAGLAVRAGQLHLIGRVGSAGPGRLSGVSVAIHATVEEAFRAIEGRAHVSGRQLS